MSALRTFLLALLCAAAASASAKDFKDYYVSDDDIATIQQRCRSLTQGLQTAKDVPLGLFLMACEVEMTRAVEDIVNRRIATERR